MALQLLDDEIAEEAAIVGKPAQRRTESRHRLLVRRVEPLRLEHLDEIAELDRLVAFGFDHAGHGAAFSSGSALSKKRASVERAAERTSGWGSRSAMSRREGKA